MASIRLSYSDVQILALVPLMSTQNPLVLMSCRGIFYGEYFLSTLWGSTFTTDSSKKNQMLSNI